MTSNRITAALRTGAALALAGLLGLAGSEGPYAGAGVMFHPAMAAAPYQSVQRTALSGLVLSPHDVTAAFGGGFVRQPGVGLGSEVLGGRLNSKVGRISGYGSAYIRQHPNPIMLNSGVTLFRNKGFAVAAVRRVYTVYNNPENQKDRVRVESLYGLGDSALVLSYDLGRQKGTHFRELCIMFSQGAYAADVVLVAGGSIDRDALLSLAGKIDSRIKNA